MTEHRYVRPIKQIIDGVVYDINGRPIDDELEDDVLPDGATARIPVQLMDGTPDEDDENEDDGDDDHDESTGDAMPMTLDAVLPSRWLLVLSPGGDRRQAAYDARVARIANAWRQPAAQPVVRDQQQGDGGRRAASDASRGRTAYLNRLQNAWRR